MEYLKPLVEFISLDEMDVIVTSGCIDGTSGGGTTCRGSIPTPDCGEFQAWSN